MIPPAGFPRPNTSPSDVRPDLPSVVMASSERPWASRSKDAASRVGFSRPRV